MADEIITRYKLDATGYIQGAQQIEAETKSLIDDNKKLEASFNKVSDRTAQALSVESVRKASNEAKKALNETAKAADQSAKSVSAGAKDFLKQQKLQQQEIEKSKRGFLEMRKELKAVQGQLATLVLQGKEGTKEFKELSARAGQLKDQMADLGDAVNLQGASPLENFAGSLGSARSALGSLDLEGAARAFGIAGAQISKISFKDLIGGVKETITSFAKLAVGIISSPIFLIGGVIAGIVYAITTWESELDVLAKKNEKAAAAIKEQLDAVTNSYDNQIAEARALGKETDKLEIEKARKIISANEKISKSNTEFLVKRQAQLQKEAKESILLADKTVAERIDILKSQDEQYQKIREETLAADREIENARSAINQLNNAKIKESNDKSNEAYKKFLEDRKKLLEGFAKEVALLQQEEARQSADIIAEGQKKIDAIIQDNNKKQQADNKAHQDQKRKDTEQALRQQFSDEELSFEDRNRALQEAYDQDLVSWDEYNAIKKKLIEDEVNFNIAQRRREVDATLKFAGDILSITDSLITIANEANFKNAEAEKAFALFQISLNLAQSLANVILGATEAAAATGPLAPFTLAGYIASGTAAVLAAFAQFASIANQEPPGFAEGVEYVKGKGTSTSDSINARLSVGERVITASDNANYWDELHAIHDGHFEELVMLKYIQPALEAAMHEAKSSQGSSFADNIANSMLLNFKNKDVVGAVLSGHANANKNADKIVQAINKKSSRPSYRKK